MQDEGSGGEVVDGFRMAWPDLKPGDVIGQHSFGVAANERTDERRERINKEAERIVREEDDSESYEG